MRLRSLGLLLLLAAAAVPAAAAPELDVVRDEEIDPGRARIYGELRHVVRREMKPEDLLAKYASAASRPVSPREAAIAAYLYGFALRNLERPADAKKQYETALERFPRFPQAHLGLAFLALAARDGEAVHRHVEAALALDPKAWEGFLLLGALAVNDADYQGARRYFERALDMELSWDACNGLAQVCVRLWRDANLPEEKERYAKKATNAIGAYLLMHPNEGPAHLLRARTLIGLDRAGEAIEILEKAYPNTEIAEEDRVHFLRVLWDLYIEQGRLDDAQRSLERRLKHEAVLGEEERTRFGRLLEGMKAKGALALVEYQIESLLGVLRNRDAAVPVRLDALRGIVRAMLHLDRDPSMFQSSFKIRGELLKTLVDAPPALAVEVLDFLRDYFRDPALANILVYFVYPRPRSAKVREEGVRSLADICGRRALPVLLNCLKDDDGQVLRVVDHALFTLAQVRSPFSGGTTPIAEDERAELRAFWWGQLHAGALDDALVEGLTELGGSELTKARRDLEKAPLADPVAIVLLMDDDVSWRVWKAGYDFLAGYLAKDFRPPELRDREVGPEERAAITARIEAFWEGG